MYVTSTKPWQTVGTLTNINHIALWKVQQCVQTNSIFQHKKPFKQTGTMQPLRILQNLKACGQHVQSFLNNSSAQINGLLNMFVQMQINTRYMKDKLVLHILWTGPSSIGKGHKSDPIRDYTLLKAYGWGRRESRAGRRRRLQESLQLPWNDSTWHTGPLSAPQTQPMKQVYYKSPASIFDPIQRGWKRPSYKVQMYVNWLSCKVKQNVTKSQWEEFSLPAADHELQLRNYFFIRDCPCALAAISSFHNEIMFSPDPSSL